MFDGPLDRDEYMEALRRVLVSDEFMASPQLSAFLTFTVGRTLDGRGDTLKAYTVATEVFRRKSDFDPQIDPIVRVEATRLRRALERFYGSVGRDEPIKILLPRGRYSVRFDVAESYLAGKSAQGEAASAPAQDAVAMLAVPVPAPVIEPLASVPLAVQNAEVSAEPVFSDSVRMLRLAVGNLVGLLAGALRRILQARPAKAGTTGVLFAMTVTFGISAWISVIVQQQYPSFNLKPARAKVQADVFSVAPTATVQRPAPSERLASLIVEPLVRTSAEGEAARAAEKSHAVASGSASLTDAFSDDLRLALSGFEGFSVLVGHDPAMVDQNSLYVLRTRLLADSDGARLIVHLSKAHFGIIVWSASFPLKDMTKASRHELLQAIATGAAGENSALIRHLAREQASSQLGTSSCILSVAVAKSFPNSANLSAAAACSASWLQANPKSAFALRLSAQTALKDFEAQGQAAQGQEGQGNLLQAHQVRYQEPKALDLKTHESRLQDGERHDALPLVTAYLHAKQAVALDPSSARARDVLADVLFAQGKVQEALVEGRAAVMANPFDAAIAASQRERQKRID